jgi:hypothetical protein
MLKRCKFLRSAELRPWSVALELALPQAGDRHLIAAGLLNWEIAEQLTLSIRTVEGHVYRMCFKLNVADRDELAELMRRESSH